MAKNKENSSNGSIQKLTGKELLERYWYLLAALVIITFVGMWLGYAIELAGGINKVIKHPERFADEYLTLSTFGGSLLQVFTLEGGAADGALFGFIAGLMVFFGFVKPNKRYHRKGVEHGSARWGKKAEKNIISDTNDFYNNVICSSDVLLVLDRKKRDENAMTPKELAEYKRKKELAESKERDRVQALNDELNEIKKQYGG